MINLDDFRLIEILPPNMKDDNIKALCFAIDKEFNKLINHISKAKILCDINNVDENTLDYMALDLKVKCYDEKLSYEKKLALFKENVYKSKFTMGTAFTVSNILSVLYGGAQVVEWFEDNKEAYTFMLRVKSPKIESQEDFLNYYNEMVLKTNEIKNARSQLSKIVMYIHDKANVYIGSYTTIANHIKILPYMPSPIKVEGKVNSYVYTKTGQTLLIKGKE